MNKTKKMIALAVTAAIATAILSCTFITVSAATDSIANESPSITATQTYDLKMTNPWTDCHTDYEKAQEISGFRFYIPHLSSYSINATKGLVEINVITDDGKTTTFRKGTDIGDISGIYENYDYVSINDARVADFEATLGLGKDGKAYAAYWTDGKFSYSVSCDKGMTSEEAIEKIISVPVQNN